MSPDCAGNCLLQQYALHTRLDSKSIRARGKVSVQVFSHFVGAVAHIKARFSARLFAQPEFTRQTALSPPEADRATHRASVRQRRC